MVALYENIASKKMNRSHALRTAMLEMMKKTRQKYGYASPLYWGAFVFMGEP